MRTPLSPEDISCLKNQISAGNLLVVPTDTVYGIAADPFSSAAVDKLLTAKGRGRDFPSPVLVNSIAQAASLVPKIPPLAKCFMDSFWPGALTIVLQARPDLPLDLGVTGGTVALRQPNQADLLQLLTATGPLAVTSANLHGLPPAQSAAEAKKYFGDEVAAYLDAGPSRIGEPSTIVKVEDEEYSLIRVGAIAPPLLSAVAGKEPKD
ncbi:L-threonylcarbamoyladenylate synthase [uncultured Varibaculum sp.]|uniref:L-threonylcarbamoyladenylate synthase n=1 Tax=uncultured Varibaculum sp. TaxID=413896 RepID=UPI0025954258|nr:L-threonylcarbamoyladenylate synthase [uncultured Varibaculum sp.]